MPVVPEINFPEKVKIISVIQHCSIDKDYAIAFTIELTLDGKKILDLNAAEVYSPILELILGPVIGPISPNEKEGGFEPTIEAPEARSIFEKGSSFGIPFTTKNQKKNYLRRVRRKIAKSRKVEPEAVEDLPIPASSPLLQGSHFHPLATASGEERVSRIASIPPCPVDYSTKRTHKEKQLQRTRMLRNIIHTCAAQTPVGLIISSDVPVVDPISASVSSSKPPPITPELSTRRPKDSTLYDVGAFTLQTPAPSIEVNVPHSVEDATLLTTSSGAIEGE
ncbi:hypothetical protein IEQ34_005940 [Dendrobium chrysotoxum]|uniref:Uncharacterized protein n=1 Tax=Dendrobium chrysotoxum TaxID=161865 RepID=A0AAV7HAA9_DENCH|nr:hypothetical protein IEQ34_005940 [Dendrobium chrysotoxum]